MAEKEGPELSKDNMVFSKSQSKPRMITNAREFAKTCPEPVEGFAARKDACPDFEQTIQRAMLHIDNPMPGEYTGNHYERYGDSKPRTNYGQVSVPFLLRGMSDHQVNPPNKIHPP